MRPKKLLLTLVGLLLSLGLWAQQVVISPIPHTITWGGEAFDNTTTYRLTGEADADPDAVAALRAALRVENNGAVEIVLGERGDAAVEDYAGQIPQKAEGYYLNVSAGQVIIAGNDESGTFYGVQSFLQVAAQPKVMSVVVKDYPDVPERGVIEGFYGNPWSQTDRLRQFDFYGKNKMNCYVYGPKDDPYHRGQWRTPYPTAEANKLRELVEAAHHSKVKFVWAIHPGGDIKWNATDSANIVSKLETVYNLGVRVFAVFFDDIGGEGAKAIKQAQLMNYINAEFVRKHTDVEPLMICPTQYNRAWSGGDYLTTLGTQMDADVRIMWTGNSVVDMINKGDMDWINAQISRKAFIWLNYPVNDYCITRMLMGPTYGNDKNIASLMSGFCSNPMEYAEASKVSLYSIADYSWNQAKYDENASWERAIKYLMPQHADAFRLFCENNIDLGTTAHGLRRANESASFKPYATAFDAAVADGYNEAACDSILPQFARIISAADELLADESEPELTAEITPWVRVMKYVGERGQKVMDMAKALVQENETLFVQLYQEEVALEEAQKNVISRNFDGSIKKPNPAVASEVIVPFVKKHLAELVRQYKKNFTYMSDIFPKDLFEEGRYYIIYQGKYLTDKNADPNRTGDRPEFVAERDTINPMRQEWILSIDPSTERYKIVNAQDGRYVNENGKFWADKTINAYSSAWNSYNIFRMNGKCAIQNAGSAGNKFWTSNGTYINQSTSNELRAENFLFEIIPIDKQETYPTVEDGQAYYIMYDGKVLENTNSAGTGGTPTFKDYSRLKGKKQQWKFTLDTSLGRYKLTCASDNRYVNELGNFGTNPYSNAWNTYVLTEQGGLVSVQNAGSAGTDFWTVDKGRIQKGSAPRKDSYLFRILTVDEMVGVKPLVAEATGVSYRNDKGNISVKSPSPIKFIQVLSTDGQLMRESRGVPSICVSELATNSYVLLVSTDRGKKSFKLKLP